MESPLIMERSTLLLERRLAIAFTNGKIDSRNSITVYNLKMFLPSLVGRQLLQQGGFTKIFTDRWIFVLTLLGHFSHKDTSFAKDISE